MRGPFLRLFPILLLGLSGCASVSVDDVQSPETSRIVPQQIYVQEFEATASIFRVGRGEAGTERFRAAMARQLATAIAQRASQRLMPTTPIEWNAKVPNGPCWLLTGRFIRVNQGSRALRTVVGFGLGGTKLETEVVMWEISRGRKREVLRFKTTGGSNASPGVAPGLVIPNLWLISLDTLVKIGPGLSHDMNRTARQIVAVLSEYMVRENLIPPKKVYRSKKLGKWP